MRRSSCSGFESDIRLKWAAEKWGYRKVMAGSLVATIGFIFLFFFATNLQMLLAAEILCGIPWGSVSISGYSRCTSLSSAHSLSDLDYVLRLRSRSGSITWLSYNLGKCLLGHWSTHLLWCPSSLALQDRSMGMAHPICHSGEWGFLAVCFSS